MGWTKKRSVARYTQTIPPHVPLQASDYGYDSSHTLLLVALPRVQEGPPPSLQEEINAYPKLKSREVAGCREMRGHDRSIADTIHRLHRERENDRPLSTSSSCSSATLIIRRTLSPT